jgi:hypothetical protein
MTELDVLLKLLVDSEAEFIVVGGVAALAHGAGRVTFDLDIVYRRSPENLTKLVTILKEFKPYPRGAPPGLPFLWDERTLTRGLNFTLRTLAGDIDLLGEITGGGDYEKLLPHTALMKPYGIPCRCLTVSKLIEVKIAAGRPKDYEAIAELETIQEEQRSGRDPQSS